MNSLSIRNRNYAIRRPVTAFITGTVVAIFAGLIGLGGAEFRLPLLIMTFALYPHRAIRINLLVSLITLATAGVARLRFIHDTQVHLFVPEIVAMSVAGIAAAWVGAGLLARIPKRNVTLMIAILLGIIAILLVAETTFSNTVTATLPDSGPVQIAVALVAGIGVGAVSSLLGVAGGEFIIPILIFVFGADIRTAGTASVLISMPIVVAGVVRHIRAGRFRSRSMLTYLVLPMSLGSVLGAIVGGYVSAWVPTYGLRLTLAGILLVSSAKLLRQPTASE